MVPQFDCLCLNFLAHARVHVHVDAVKIIDSSSAIWTAVQNI